LKVNSAAPYRHSGHRTRLQLVKNKILRKSLLSVHSPSTACAPAVTHLLLAQIQLTQPHLGFSSLLPPRGHFTAVLQKYYMQKLVSGKGAWKVWFKILLSTVEPNDPVLSTCSDDSPSFLEQETVIEGWPDKVPSTLVFNSALL